MPNLRSGGQCVCPYYIGESEKSISCEGLLPGTRVINRFGGAEEREAHQWRACCTFQYVQKCAVAEALEEKYREEG